MSADSSTPPASLKEIFDQLPETKYGSEPEFLQGKVPVKMFPEGIIALNRELATGLHPRLEKALAEQAVQGEDWTDRLAQIAAYCGVILDEAYSMPDVDKLAFTLAGRLEALREAPAGIILSS